MSEEEMDRLVMRISASVAAIKAASERGAVALDPLAGLDEQRPPLSGALTPEFRERARRMGRLLRAYQAEEDLKFRPHVVQHQTPEVAEPIDEPRVMRAMAQHYVANLLKTVCGTRRRARLPEGPTRRSSTEGDRHGR